MDKVNSYLADWGIKFLENKDAIRKEIVKMEKNVSGFDFVIHYKDKVRYFIVNPILGDDIVNILKNSKGIFGIQRKTKGFSGKPEIHKSEFLSSPKIAKRFSSGIKADGYFGIITLNNMTNIKFVVSNWEKLASFKFLNAYFVNPFSSSDKVWVINPYIHDNVCDKSSLELGLKSLAEMVAPLGVEELNNKIKSLKEESDL